MAKWERLNTQKFIERAKTVHGNTYDYSEIVYVKSTVKVKVKCNKCGHKWKILPHNHLKGNGCKKCQYKKLSQNQSQGHENFVAAAKKVHGDKYEYVGMYKNVHAPVRIKCNICGDIFKQRASSHLSGCGCKKCQYRCLPQNLPMLVSVFEDRCRILHDDRYEYYGDYRGNRVKIKIRCKKHDYVFMQLAGAHLYHEQGCPKCDASKGELKIEKFLQVNGFQYEAEKKFQGCINKLELSFDFYLSERNLCIEYDGEQHYRPIACFGGRGYLQKVKHHDEIKSKFCADNKIRLLRIPFFEYNHIEEILRKEIC